MTVYAAFLFGDPFYNKFHLSHHNPALLPHPPQKTSGGKQGRKETLAANASALLSKGFISDSADSKPQKWRISPQTPPSIVGKSWDILVFPHVWNSDNPGTHEAATKQEGILDWKWYEFHKKSQVSRIWWRIEKWHPTINATNGRSRKQKGILLVDAAVIFRLSLVDGVLFVCCKVCGIRVLCQMAVNIEFFNVEPNGNSMHVTCAQRIWTQKMFNSEMSLNTPTRFCCYCFHVGFIEAKQFGRVWYETKIAHRMCSQAWISAQHKTFISLYNLKREMGKKQV